MLFIQTEGASRSADSAAAVLFIQTEGVSAGKRKGKISRCLRGFAQGNCMLIVKVLSVCMISCIYSAPFLETDSDLDWESLSHFASSSNKPTPTGILNFPSFRDFIPCWSRILVAPGLPRPFYLSGLLMIGFGRPCQLARALLFGP